MSGSSVDHGLSFKAYSPEVSKMKTKLFSVCVLFFSSLLFLFTSFSLAGFRCGNKLVHEGDTKAEVIYKCGEPDFVEAWEEKRIQRDYYPVPTFSTRMRKYYWYREPFLVEELIRIEEWTYNFGSTQFLRFLRFENGVLRDISRGGYGY
jgi:hypothetical protein